MNSNYKALIRRQSVSSTPRLITFPQRLSSCVYGVITLVALSMLLIMFLLPSLEDIPRATKSNAIHISVDGSNRLHKVVLNQERANKIIVYESLEEVPFLNEAAGLSARRMTLLHRTNNNARSIFISMSSYRDENCGNTLKYIFEKCKYCSNVFVGLVDQMNKDKDKPCEPPEQFRFQVRTVRISSSLAKGPTMARHLASKLWAGEAYYMQIDAHLTFIDNWDEVLLAMIPRMPSSKFIISHYPVATVDELKPGNIQPFICIAKFDEYMKGLFSQDSDWYQIVEHDNVPQAAPFVGAGFQFSPSEVLFEVPFDPYLDFLFHGEEFLYAARAYTHGWDLVVPTQNIASHVYGKRKFNAYVEHSEAGALAEHARNRVRYLTGVTKNKPERSEELEAYGLGSIRTMSDYEAYSGVFLLTQNSSNHCKQIFDWSGYIWFDKNAVRPKPFRKRFTLETLPHYHEAVPDYITRIGEAQQNIATGSIFVSLVSYRDHVCEDTLNEIFSKCFDCDKIFVGLVEQHQARDSRCRGPDNRRGQVTLVDLPAHRSKGPTFARYIASKLYINEEFYLQIDSHHHFAPEWDRLLRDMYSNLPTSKGIISTYPVIDSTSLDDATMHVPWICQATINPMSNLIVQYANAWYNSQDVRLQPLNAQIGSTPFLGAGFLFGHASFLVDVPYDKYLSFLFHGEELLMAARLWTSGWDFFIPTQNVVSHIYYKRDFTVYADNAAAHAEKIVSWQRVRYILGLDSELPLHNEELEYVGLGTQRSLDEYWSFTGLDWSTGQHHSRCSQVYDYKNKIWLTNPDDTKVEAAQAVQQAMMMMMMEEEEGVKVEEGEAS